MNENRETTPMKRSRRSIRNLKKQLKKDMRQPKATIDMNIIRTEACKAWGLDELVFDPGAKKMLQWCIMSYLIKLPHPHRQHWREI